MAQDLNSQLLDAIQDLRKSPTTEWETKKAIVLELFEKGATILQNVLDDLEKYLSDLEQEYWDDRAVYAGRSVKDSDEYEKFNILSKLNNAKDKKKSLNALFKIAKSKGVIYTPKNKAELKKLIKDKNIYLGDIDISNITNFKDLFRKSRRRDFSGIETWDTSKVTNMDYCFDEAEHFNHNIESWDVSNVKSIQGMFQDTPKFNQPLNKWNVSKVRNFVNIFYNAQSFNQSIESWGEKIDFKESDLEAMFIYSKIQKDKSYPSWYCTRDKNSIYQPKHGLFLKEMLEYGISPAKIDTSFITDMGELFEFASSKETEWFSGVENWDVSNVTNMYAMFKGCKKCYKYE